MCAADFRFIQKHLIEAILRHGSEQYETGHNVQYERNDAAHKRVGQLCAYMFKQVTTRGNCGNCRGVGDRGTVIPEYAAPKDRCKQQRWRQVE